MTPASKWKPDEQQRKRGLRTDSNCARSWNWLNEQPARRIEQFHEASPFRHFRTGCHHPITRTFPARLEARSTKGAASHFVSPSHHPAPHLPPSATAENTLSPWRLEPPHGFVALLVPELDRTPGAERQGQTEAQSPFPPLPTQFANPKKSVVDRPPRIQDINSRRPASRSLLARFVSAGAGCPPPLRHSAAYHDSLKPLSLRPAVSSARREALAATVEFAALR